MDVRPLVVAATLAEIADIVPLLERSRVPYVITGVGMVATTHALTNALRRHTPAYVLNVGIAGSLSRDLPIGSLVEVVHDTLSELGAEQGEDFIPIDDMGFGASSWTNTPPATIHTGLNKVEGMTVNRVHGNVRAIENVKRRLPNVRTESMEGAAVFYVCKEENIPCIQVRAISNYVELRNKSAWDIPLAVQNLQGWLADFLSLA